MDNLSQYRQTLSKYETWRCLSRVFRKLVNLFQIPAKAIIIQAIAYHKFIGDAETDIIEVQMKLCGFRLVQQCRYL